jgi:hypothetical protein
VTDGKEATAGRIRLVMNHLKSNAKKPIAKKIFGAIFLRPFHAA